MGCVPALCMFSLCLWNCSIKLDLLWIFLPIWCLSIRFDQTSASDLLVLLLHLDSKQQNLNLRRLKPFSSSRQLKHKPERRRNTELQRHAESNLPRSAVFANRNIQQTVWTQTEHTCSGNYRVCGGGGWGVMFQLLHEVCLKQTEVRLYWTSWREIHSHHQICSRSKHWLYKELDWTRVTPAPPLEPNQVTSVQLPPCWSQTSPVSSDWS